MSNPRVPCSALFLAAALALAAPPGDPLRAEDFERPPVLKASDILPEEVRKGAHHEVAEEVPNDGYMNLYRIASDYGRFEAYGKPTLAIRVQEIGALAELAEVSKAEVFAGSTLRAITSPVTAVAEFAKRPVETLKGVGGGIGRMYKRAKRTAGEIKEDLEERDEEGGEAASGGEAEAAKKYANKYFGVTGGERRWSEKLGVDPYTTNEILRKAIREVARVDAAGSFSVKLVGMPSIPGVRLIADVNQLVWSKDPGELKELNARSLAGMGVDETLIERFFDNPFFLSPSRQTRFVAALAALDGVVDRPVAVELAAGAKSEAEALFQVGNALMLQWLHGGEAPLARLAPSRIVPVGLTADGRLAVAVPLDYVVWTEDLAASIERLGEIGSGLGARRREVWFGGEASERCRRELEDRGWKIYTGVAAKAEP